MPEVNLLLFGPARDAQRSESVVVKVQSLPCTVSHLRQVLPVQFPDLGPVLAMSIFAVANKLISRSTEKDVSVSLSEEVVLVPPVSGG